MACQVCMGTCMLALPYAFVSLHHYIASLDHSRLAERCWHPTWARWTDSILTGVVRCAWVRACWRCRTPSCRYITISIIRSLTAD
jgi:hypothetical protein